MVGVPGRSKGCSTCRKRRIACSLERPHCAKCIKSNRVCGGYLRERVFVFHSDSAGDVSKSDVRKTARALQQSRQSPSPIARDFTRALEPVDQNSSLVRQERTIPVISPLTAYRQQVFGEFMSQYLPVHRTWGFRAEDPGFISLFGSIPQPHVALESAVLAVCTAKLSRWRDDPMLAKESLKLYGRGLHELQQALWDPDLMNGDEVLAASMALLLYEAIECPEKSVNGWVSHLNGCGKLIRIRGPKAHSTPLGHKVFLAYRINEIHVAVRSHRATFLSDPEWMNGPWTNRNKTALDKVLDAAAVLSRVFHEAVDGTQGVEPQKLLPILLEQVNRCWKLDLDLCNIYKEYEAENLGPLFWPVFTAEDGSDTSQDEEILFPVIFHFRDLRAAQTCMLYWAVSAFLVVVISFLHQQIQSLQLVDVTTNSTINKDICGAAGLENDSGQHCTGTGLKPLQERHDVLALSRKICQSVEYCAQGEMKDTGQMITIIPLVSVIDILNQHPCGQRELEWAKMKMDSFKNSVKVMKYTPEH